MSRTGEIARLPRTVRDELNGLCAHIVARRRGDHEAARIGAMKALHWLA